VDRVPEHGKVTNADTGGQQPDLGYDDRIVTGWWSMAQTREAAEAVIERLNKDHEGMNV